MTAPNLLSPSIINGKSTYVSLSTTNETDLITNASASNKVLRITHITIANTSASGTADITVKLYSAASGGTGYAIASNVTIPVGASIIVIGKENPVYLEEDRRITVTASAANYLVVTCSYEEIS